MELGVTECNNHYSALAKINCDKSDYIQPIFKNKFFLLPEQKNAPDQRPKAFPNLLDY
jgi:hypothetical protein